MGTLNLLKGSWEGKVGETVGSKWKNKNTIRTYTKPSNPDTAAQQTVRGVFKDMTQFVALFSDQMKYLNSLDTRGQSVRNAIIQLNKSQISAGTFTKSTLQVNRGGLPNVTGFSLGTLAIGNSLTATFTAPAATNISDDAVIVVAVIDQENLIAAVSSAALSAETITVSVPCTASATLDVYYWVIDYRGSSRVGSRSGYVTGTVPSA